MKAGSNYSYKVKYVKHREVKGQIITSFNIGEKIRDTNPAEYQNYQITVWKNIALRDGEEVLIKSIEAVTASNYNGKRYINVSAEIEVKEHEIQQFADEQADYMPPTEIPATSMRKNTGDFELPTASDDPYKLPFDV